MLYLLPSLCRTLDFHRISHRGRGPRLISGFHRMLRLMPSRRPTANLHRITSRTMPLISRRLQLDVISRPACAEPLNFHRISHAGKPAINLRLPLNVTTHAEPATNFQSPSDNILSQAFDESPTSIECCISCLACADPINFRRISHRGRGPQRISDFH